MRSATIVREKKDRKRIHVRISSDKPDTGGDVEVMEILNQKEDETHEQFQERVIRFIEEQSS